MYELLLPLFGFIAGIIAALIGVGGGILIVPILTIIYEFLPADAVGTSLTTIIFTATAATINYARQKRIYYRTGLVLAITTAPGAYLGAYLTTIIAPKQLGLIFGVFLLFVAARMILDRDTFRRKSVETEKEKAKPTAKSDSELARSGKTIVLGAGLSFFGGVASGLLGIGGGVLVVPIMALAMGMPMHLATATSMFTMIFTSISGDVQHYMASHINFEYAALIAVGSILGAQVGAYTSTRISGRNLRRVFAIVLVIVSIQMIQKYM